MRKVRALVVIVLLVACVGCGLSRGQQNALNATLAVGEVLLGIATGDVVAIISGASALGLSGLDATVTPASTNPPEPLTSPDH